MFTPREFYELTFTSYLTGQFNYTGAANTFIAIVASVMAINVIMFICVIATNSVRREFWIYALGLILIPAICLSFVDSTALILGNQHFYNGINITDFIDVCCDGDQLKKTVVINNVYSIPEGDILATYNFTAISASYVAKNTTSPIKYLDWTFEYTGWEKSYIIAQIIKLIFVVIFWPVVLIHCIRH